MIAAGLAFVLANCAMVRLPVVLDTTPLIWVAPIALSGLCYPIARLVACFYFGVVLTQIEISEQQRLRVATTFETELVGQVCDLPVNREDLVRFMFCPDGERHVGARYRLSWYQPGSSLEPGQRWRLPVKVRPPRGSANTGLFDYERWLFVHGIHGRGYVTSPAGAIRLHDSGGELIDSYRYRVRAAMVHAMPDLELGTFFALSLGDTSGLSSSQWATLNGTGTTHLLIVSGLHTGLIAGLSFMLFRFLGMPLRILTVATIGTTALYAALAGWGLPVQRAFVMSVTVLVCMNLSRQINVTTQYVVALVLVLVVDPLATLGNGFWLSFGAVFALMFGMTARGVRTGVAGWFENTLGAQWVVYVGMTPLLALTMSQLPLASFLVNLIAIPWVGVLLVPLLMIGLLLMLIVEPLGLWVLEGVSWQITWLWRGLEAASSAGGILLLPTQQLPGMILIGAGAILLLLPRGLTIRWPALFCIALLLRPVHRTETGDLTATFLDVGQGLSVVLATRSSLVLYDTGPEFGERFSAAQQIVLPALQQVGRDRINTLIISHSDNDHAGGVDVLLERIPIHRRFDHTNCEGRWQSDGVRFRSFKPVQIRGTTNNLSCLLLVRAHGQTLLLTGDIEADGELALLKQSEVKLADINVMSSPHHGSDSSSTPALLNALHPEVVIVSSGYENRFGHPHIDVLNRYRLRHMKVLNTANDGSVTVRFTADGYTIHRARMKRTIWRQGHEQSDSPGSNP